MENHLPTKEREAPPIQTVVGLANANPLAKAYGKEQCWRRLKMLNLPVWSIASHTETGSCLSCPTCWHLSSGPGLISTGSLTVKAWHNVSEAWRDIPARIIQFNSLQKASCLTVHAKIAMPKHFFAIWIDNMYFLAGQRSVRAAEELLQPKKKRKFKKIWVV